MLTVVSIFHRPSVLRVRLLDSLRRQEAKYELILIDNTKAAYRSPAPAFNSIEPGGDFVLFVHQDVYLLGRDFLRKAEDLLSTLGPGVAGLAGIGEEAGGHIVGRSFHGSPPTPVGRFIEEPLEVQTVDEFAFFVPSKLLERVKFDESVIDSFHLYAVDYCPTVKALGMRNYVLPLSAYHAGAGPLPRREALRKFPVAPPEYYRTFERVRLKWLRRYRAICTTVTGCWPVNLPAWYLRIRHVLSYTTPPGSRRIMDTVTRLPVKLSLGLSTARPLRRARILRPLSDRREE